MTHNYSVDSNTFILMGQQATVKQISALSDISMFILRTLKDTGYYLTVRKKHILLSVSSGDFELQDGEETHQGLKHSAYARVRAQFTPAPGTKPPRCKQPTLRSSEVMHTPALRQPEHGCGTFLAAEHLAMTLPLNSVARACGDAEKGSFPPTSPHFISLHAGSPQTPAHTSWKAPRARPSVCGLRPSKADHG